MTHLWDRLAQAKKELEPVQSKYKIVYEDPNEPLAAAKIVTPDPNWLAAALAGGVLPPIEAYLHDQSVEKAWHKLTAKTSDPNQGFSWSKEVGGAHHPYAEPIGPMSEEEALEYLVMKDVPASVWHDYVGNKQILVIVPVEAIPTDRTNRDAWKIDQMEIV